MNSILAFAGTTAQSLTNPEPVATTVLAWHYHAALYGWGTALDGDVTLRGNKVPVDLGFGDVLDNLDYAVMGAFEIGNCKWNFL